MAKTHNFVSKIPRTYTSRVLGRLLPSAVDMVDYNHEQLLRVKKYKAEIERTIKADPLRYFLPNPGGQSTFLRQWDIDQEARVLFFFAGNKTGKTTGGAALMGERLLGHALWDKQNRRHVAYPTPATGIVLTEDFESHIETILPNILSWWPRGTVTRIMRNNNNNPTELHLNNGSVLRFKTFAQGAETAEGKDWDLVWIDEPPSQSLYTAVFRGLVATDGRMYITATLLKEAWLFDEGDKDFARMFQSSIYDNKWLSSDARDAFLASLPEEERDVRESGKPISLTGLVYPRFKAEAPWIIPLSDIPKDVPHIIGIDPHERRPLYVLFGILTPFNSIVWYHYCFPKGTVSEIMEQLEAERKKWDVPFPRICVMDPNRGKAKQLDNTSWEEKFEEAGYDVLLGEDNQAIGHQAVRDWLAIDRETGMPRMMWTENCTGWGGPVYQMLRYSWDNWQKHLRHEKPLKEKPKDTHKDFPDIHRYVAMAELNYDALKSGYDTLRVFEGEKAASYGRV